MEEAQRAQCLEQSELAVVERHELRITFEHETELVLIVTPRLVQPSTPGQNIATPLDGTQPANDAEFFALGQMEVTPKMLKAFQSGAGAPGPYGYIIDLGEGTPN